MTVVEDARALQDDMVALRRALHREPEVGLRLPRTQEKVLSGLAGVPGLELTTGASSDAVVAVLRGGRSDGRSVLLRGDMDALPIDERSGLDFASTNGAMHACGHDFHTAMLVGAAQLIGARRAELTGDVVFMFQPGEEGFDGARLMIEEGVLDASGRRPDHAYAMHVVSSMYGHGQVVTRPGPFMAAANVLHVTVRGAGGHASAPHLALDPVPVAAEMVGALQTLVTRRFNVFDPVVLTVGSLHAGTQHNIIPDTATLEATVRSFSEQATREICERAVRLCESLAHGHGLRAEVEWETLYPPTVNAEDEAAYVVETALETLGDAGVAPMPHPVAGSEDFSRVLQQVPGAMMFLGACPAGLDPAVAPYNHAADAVFDEAVLGSGAALHTALVLGRLAG